MRHAPTRVGLIGHGAIGSVVAQQLVAGALPEMQLTAVLDPPSPHPDLAVATLTELLDRSDLVVEAAGHEALTAYGPAIIESGTGLLVVSAGALADAELHERLRTAGEGRLMITTGAIGGIDTLRAAHLADGLDEVSMTSTKPAANLLRDWMDDELQSAIQTGAAAVVAFEGTAREACGRFPESANVFATLALATIGMDSVHARLVADPHAARVEHVVSAHGRLGSYEFSFANRPSAANPKTSAIVPWSVLRALSDLNAAVDVFV